MKNTDTVLTEKPDGKRPLGRPRRTWEGRPDIKTDFKIYVKRMWIGFIWLEAAYIGGLLQMWLLKLQIS
jgi:hypothetical protein